MTYPHSLGSGLVREEVTEDIQLGNPGGLPRGGVLDTGPEGRAVSDRTDTGRWRSGTQVQQGALGKASGRKEFTGPAAAVL